jgi:imidazolonepropionase-like amidohydrolase
MSRTRWICGLAALLAATAAGAQDLTITNARIIDGTGRVIDRGSVVVRGGKIESVAAGTPSATAGRRLDAGGKTVMPGFIDAHRHVVAGDATKWLADTAAKQLQGFLDAGFTTVLGAIDPPQLLEARKLIEQGKLRGPRLYVGMFLPVAGATGPPPADDPARTDASRGPRNGPPAPAIPHEATIQQVQAAKQAGFDYLKVVFIVTPGGPELDTLKLIVSEGKKVGMPTIVHAVSVIDTLTALDAHPDVLVHTPHIGRLDEDPYAIRKIVEAKIPMTSTLAVFLPHFAADNTPLFRDAKPFPWNTLSSAGQGPVNARLLWNAGLVSYGYGTDTQWPPKESLQDELRALEVVFSPTDIVKIITKNAANSTLHAAEIGTLEPGKFGDMVIVDGDPLTDSRALLHVTTTIKGGEVVFGGPKK